MSVVAHLYPANDPLPETRLQMAERHIREGQARIARQYEIIAKLRHEGHSTLAAEGLLAVFETTLAGFREQLELLRKIHNFEWVSPVPADWRCGNLPERPNGNLSTGDREDLFIRARHYMEQGARIRGLAANELQEDQRKGLDDLALSYEQLGERLLGGRQAET
jgi:hypothetical protein